MEPVELHAQVETAFNAADVEALVALYEPDAVLLGEDGSSATGLDAIRDAWKELTSFGGTLAVTTRYAVTNEEVALLSNQWEFTLDGAVAASAITAEVARRQPDGRWLYVLDNPYAVPAS